MTTRFAAARAFAEAKGWEFLIDDRNDPKSLMLFVTARPEKIHRPIPAPDAPLHEHLAFVGRVAEALGLPVVANCGFTSPPAMVAFGNGLMKMASDPSWAALLAGTAALAAKGAS